MYLENCHNNKDMFVQFVLNIFGAAAFKCTIKPSAKRFAFLHKIYFQQPPNRNRIFQAISVHVYFLNPENSAREIIGG